MRRLPFLIENDQIAPAQRWELLDTLFDQTRSLYLGSLAIGLVVMLCWLRAASPWYLVWGIATALILSGRVLLARQYAGRARDQTGSIDLERWARRFCVGALATTSLLSLVTMLSFILVDDVYVQLYLVTLQVAYVGGAVSRNAASPAVVFGQLLFGLPPMALACLLSGNSAYRAYALLPLMAMLGYRAIAEYQAQLLLSTLTAHAIQAGLNAKLEDACGSLQRANAQLARLSSTDALTGIANRRAFDTALQTEWLRAAREGAPISILMFDVDSFKSYNDLLGHPAGDTCLRQVALTLDAGLRRPLDLAARFGGEEFVALLPETEADGAVQSAERLRLEVAACQIPHLGSPMGYVTISVGMATARPAPGDDPLELLRAADIALYRAKQQGRNCVYAAA